jgi:LacI family transcriptional regulator/LacI family purine nucleotide synthesis repressor
MTTINDIAKLAKVSKATVSKVLNGHPGVKDETRKNILRIMKQNNYWPNSIARSLSTNKSYTIGIFDPMRLNNFFFREVFEGIESVFGEQGYDILYFANKKWDNSWVNYGYKEKCEDRNVDGIIMMGFGRVDSSQFDSLLQSDIPTVFIDLDLVGRNASYVTSDNINGAKTAINYLYNLGHRKIAMLMGPSGFRVAHDRLLGFQTAVNELNIEYNPDWLFNGEYEIETGYNAMQEILKMPKKPTAIFGEDILAIGAIKAIEDNGFSVPEDFSVVGFDDIELSRHYDLTTISQDIIGLGESAAKLLLRIIEKANFPPVILPTKLIERKTCRKI